MIINFYKVDVEKIIKNELLVYCQIPIVPYSSYDFDCDIIDHLVSMEVDKENVVGGYYPFNRLRDLETFENLLENN